MRILILQETVGGRGVCVVLMFGYCESDRVWLTAAFSTPSGGNFFQTCTLSFLLFLF